MIYKKHVPLIFFVAGSGFIVMSGFLVWATITVFGSGEKSYVYGYERPDLYIILIISLITVFLLEFDVRFSKSSILIPLISLFLFAATQPLYISASTVKTGIGMYIALLGILFQFIGVVIAAIFENISKELIVSQHHFMYGRSN